MSGRLKPEGTARKHKKKKKIQILGARKGGGEAKKRMKCVEEKKVMQDVDIWFGESGGSST